eukprot:scaffold3540_cov147-Isochrysis_galbana.AAC.4
MGDWPVGTGEVAAKAVGVWETAGVEAVAMAVGVWVVSKVLRPKSSCRSILPSVWTAKSGAPPSPLQAPLPDDATAQIISSDTAKEVAFELAQSSWATTKSCAWRTSLEAPPSAVVAPQPAMVKGVPTDCRPVTPGPSKVSIGGYVLGRASLMSMMSWTKGEDATYDSWTVTDSTPMCSIQASSRKVSRCIPIETRVISKLAS